MAFLSNDNLVKKSFDNDELFDIIKELVFVEIENIQKEKFELEQEPRVEEEIRQE